MGSHSQKRALKSLYSFLLDSFDEEEFRRLITMLPGSGKIGQMVPGRGSPPATLFWEGVQTLARRGLLNDELFDLLEETRPQLKDRVDFLRAKIAKVDFDVVVTAGSPANELRLKLGFLVLLSLLLVVLTLTLRERTSGGSEVETKPTEPEPPEKRINLRADVPGEKDPKENLESNMRFLRSELANALPVDKPIAIQFNFTNAPVDWALSQGGGPRRSEMRANVEISTNDFLDWSQGKKDISQLVDDKKVVITGDKKSLCAFAGLDNRNRYQAEAICRRKEKKPLTWSKMQDVLKTKALEKGRCSRRQSVSVILEVKREKSRSAVSRIAGLTPLHGRDKDTNVVKCLRRTLVGKHQTFVPPGETFVWRYEP